MARNAAAPSTPDIKATLGHIEVPSVGGEPEKLAVALSAAKSSFQLDLGPVEPAKTTVLLELPATAQNLSPPAEPS